MKSIFKILLLLFPVIAFSQNQDTAKSKDEYFRENFIRYIDYIYEDNINSLVIRPESSELTDPVILLNSEEKILCSFDDLKGGVENYMYTFIHCDADWKPSDILVADYLEGFTEDYIRDYRFSFNTLQTYTHYSFSFPNEQMKIKLSGNYLLLVYPENMKDHPLISARFYVNENQLRIEGKVRQSVDLDEKYEKQQVQFNVYTDNYSIVNPYQNLKVFIRQNGRLDNMISNLQPLMIKGDQINFEHISGNVFDGGNEFRHFEIRSIKYPGDHVLSVEPGQGLYQVNLMKDERRSQKSYVTDGDINGRRVFRTGDGSDPDIDADYVDVHFSLGLSPFYSTGNIYILGELTQWQLSKKAMMKYNFNNKSYELTMKLKQGYYNYQYVLLENGQTTAEVSFIEGNHYETKNDYTILLYYREPGTLYDKLVGLTILQSN